MGRKDENTGFICENCEKKVLPLTNGSYRNHCPFCLYSRHVDTIPGDRLSGCKGLMSGKSVRRTELLMNIWKQKQEKKVSILKPYRKVFGAIALFGSKKDTTHLINQCLYGQ